MAMEQQFFHSLGPDGFHRLAYTDWGSRDNSHVVICIHGLSRNSRDFDRLAETLEASCRVVCMDVVGRGCSDWLKDKSGYCFPTYLNDAAALVARVTHQRQPGLWEALRVRYRGRRSRRALDWVGTSMGGLIGMLLAAKQNSPIRRLVLNDVGPFVPWNGLIRLKGHIGNEISFATLAEAEAHFRRVCAEFGTLDDAYWRHLAEHSVKQGEDGQISLRHDPAISRGLPVHLDPELPIGPEFLRGIDLWRIWDSVRCPVLVLRGENSRVLPEEVVQEMQRRKPDLLVAEIPEVGHVPALASDQQIGIVRDFLLADDVEALDIGTELGHDLAFGESPRP